MKSATHKSGIANPLEREICVNLFNQRHLCSNCGRTQCVPTYYTTLYTLPSTLYPLLSTLYPLLSTLYSLLSPLNYFSHSCESNVLNSLSGYMIFLAKMASLLRKSSMSSLVNTYGLPRFQSTFRKHECIRSCSISYTFL